eukprot:gene2790-3962_t
MSLAAPTTRRPVLTHTLGFPRMGAQRALKFALESFWRGDSTKAELQATAAQLRELGDMLVDIHGQHAWQSLTRAEAVRGLLDAYAQLDTSALSHSWAQWRAAQATLDEARKAQDTLQRERERLG